MAKKNRISLKHGYTLAIERDDTLTLIVATEDDTLEFDGFRGILMDASDFESHFDEEEVQMTLTELIRSATDFLKDWGADDEVTEAIVKELTPWFGRYAIEPPTTDAWLEELEGRVKELKLKEELYREEVSRVIERFRKWVATADESQIYYDAESEAKRIASARESYKAVWHEYKTAEAELNRYKEVMHL